MYDGAIPRHLLAAVDPFARSGLYADAAATLGRITEKPASIRARLALAIADIASAQAAVTRDQLRDRGFTDAQLAAHAAEALARVRRWLPGLEQMVAA